MKLRLLCITTILTASVYGQDLWIKRDSVNGPPRGACASFELNGEAFVVTGVNVEEFKRKMYSYDLDQDDWDNETGLGGDAGSGLERASAVGFSAAGFGFVGLGSGTSSPLKDLWRYDPETESWSQMADFESTPRSGAVAFSIDDIAYVGTGQDADGLQADFYKYDPISNSWTELEDFAGEGRKEAVGFTMGGKGYVGTGRANSGYLDDFWEYDPATDNWTQKADFPGTPRIGAVGCGVFPSAYIMLGEDNDFEYKDDVWEYNYFGNVWTQRADYSGGTRVQASAIVVDNRIFVGLGYNGIYHDDFYEYDRVLSTIDEESPVELSIHPNPFASEFTITSDRSLYNVKYHIYNSVGKDVTCSFAPVNRTDNKITVQLIGNLAKGTYFLSIVNESNSFSVQQIIIH